MSGFTAIPNEILDNMAALSPAEFKVLMAIYRLIIGYKEHRQNGRRVISIAQLETMCDLSRQGVVNTFNKIQELGYARKITHGRVTAWEVKDCLRVVNSVDYQKDEVVNSVDEEDTGVVNSVGNSGQLSRPHINKEKEREEKQTQSADDPDWHELIDLLDVFVDATSIKPPSVDYDAGRRTLRLKWLEPLQEIKTLANGRSPDLIREAVTYMQGEGLTVANPGSIVNVARRLHNKPPARNGRHPPTEKPLPDWTKDIKFDENGIY